MFSSIREWIVRGFVKSNTSVEAHIDKLRSEIQNEIDDLVAAEAADNLNLGE